MVKFVKLFSSIFVVTIIVGCNGGGSGSSPSPESTPPTIINNIPVAYQNLPNLNSSHFSSKIAYAGANGYVGYVANDTVRNNLESMAVALTNISGRRYCTGTPLYSNGINAFILTAAHCVVGNPKNSMTQVTTDNIVTFSAGRGYINQVPDAFTGSDVTGEITAVYLAKDYCKEPAFTKSSQNNSYACDVQQLEKQNGDMAIIKIKATTPLHINNQVKLPDANLEIAPGTLMLTMGYGITNSDANNTKLFYINYEYFGTNNYLDEAGEKVLFNGYNPVTPNVYYSIICGGDSGGGDFYWDGTSWQLVGVHSYGSADCGQPGNDYGIAFDASGDVRPFTAQISNIIHTDTTPDACDPSITSASGFICLTNPNI